MPIAVPDFRRIEGKYEILDKLSEGGMGAVYRVRHRLLDELRVIKIIRPQLGGDAKLRDRFLREARSAVRLRHPNIATLHDFTIDDDGVAFMVMEFIDGEDLKRVVARHRRLPVALGLEVGVQTLRALQYLHSQNFIHRDISPDNLMLCRDPEGRLLVKLIDLGLAKSLEGSQELLGSPGGGQPGRESRGLAQRRELTRQRWTRGRGSHPGAGGRLQLLGTQTIVRKIVLLMLVALAASRATCLAGEGKVALQTADPSCGDDSGAIYVDWGTER